MSGGGQNQPTIRSDKITWTDGFSPVDCPYLRYAVRVSLALDYQELKFFYISQKTL